MKARKTFHNLSDDSEREIIHVRDHSWEFKWPFSINIKTSLFLPREINNIVANPEEWRESERRARGTKSARKEAVVGPVWSRKHCAKQRGCGGQERSKWIVGVGGTPTTQMNGRETQAHSGLQRKGLPPDCFKAVWPTPVLATLFKVTC